MKIFVKAVKQNPKAEGASGYAEIWYIDSIESLNDFNVHCLQAIEHNTMGYIRKNKDFTEECQELDEFVRLRNKLINREVFTETFQFDSGDYIYTMIMTDGTEQHVQ